MSHPVAKPVQVTIQGKTYDLVMGYGVYLEAERLTGISTITDDEQYFEKPTRTTLAAIFYALLKAAGATFTPEQVQKMVTAKNLRSIYQTVLQCHFLAQAEAEKDAPLVEIPAA